MTNMRTEKEMFDLILGVAKEDERILSVVMNGSRANPDVAKDAYQDYDIVYVVKEISAFLSHPHWIDVFGKRAIMQCPEALDLASGTLSAIKDEYTYLMLFEDGNRIDLKLMHLEHAKALYKQCGMGIPLYDTTNTFHQVYEPQTYWIKRPTSELFYATTNEFWWCLQNVGKGLARKELPYAMELLNVYVRPQLHQMIEYAIGIHHDFKVSSGKFGKYYEQYLPEELWLSYLATFSDGTLPHIWNCVEVLCDLFHTLAIEVATSLNFPYAQGEEDGLRLYLDIIKAGIPC